MSATWNDGYVTEIGYTHGYYRELSPGFQRFCLLLNGFAADAGSNTHCELGFGQGVSIAIHSAANPGMYVGTDFNPAHAAEARSLAAAGGGANGGRTRLYDDSFEQLLERNDLPAFDSISLHGIWTWVSRANHHVITEFARRHLKPGGAFFISYNCFPGWSAGYPLRHLMAMHDRYAAPPTGTVKRVEAALAFSERFLAIKPGFARGLPGTDERLKALQGQDKNYLAHEYFNRDWNVMFFAEVADFLSAAKLDFAGSASPLDILEAINLSPEAVAFLKEVEQPVLREQIRDYCVNQQFRRDLYLRGARRISGGEQRTRLMAMRFALVRSASEVPMTLKGPNGEGTLQPELYQPIINALADRSYAPCSIAELMKTLPTEPFARILQAVAVLVGQGSVMPCHSEVTTREVRANCEALNAALCERALSGPGLNVLASPVTGSGVTVSRMSQLFLLAQLRKVSDVTGFVLHVLQINNEKLLKDNLPVEDAAEAQAMLAGRHQDYIANVLPLLKGLGIA